MFFGELSSVIAIIKSCISLAFNQSSYFGRLTKKVHGFFFTIADTPNLELLNELNQALLLMANYYRKTEVHICTSNNHGFKTVQTKIHDAT